MGAGVAGCAAALELLSDGFRIAILHRHDDVPGIETLAPSAVTDLRRLSIQIGCVLPEIVAWWGSDSESRTNQHVGRIVQRIKLAETLRARALELGATVIDIRKAYVADRSPVDWTLNCESPLGEPHLNLVGKYLVDATGRSAAIATQLGARRVTFDRLSCVTMQLSQPQIVGTWTESVADGWWNLSCTRDEGTLSFYSTAPVIRTVGQDMSRWLGETRHLQFMLSTSGLRQARVRPCGSSRLVPCAGDGWVAMGDAAATLQPLASAGVSNALQDARFVRSALKSPPAQYERFHLVQFRQYLKTLKQHYSLERRWLMNPFWFTSSSSRLSPI